MKILLTGMSGVGKSSVLGELAKLGYATLDLDYGYGIFDTALGEKLLDIEKVKEVLKREEQVFLAGCFRNQGQLYPLLDGVFLLTAPLAVMQSRIAGRTDNPYGKSAQEWQEIKQNKEEIEPLLAQSCTAIIDASQPLPALVTEILEHAKALVEK